MSVHQLRDGRWVVIYPNPEPPPKQKWEYFGRGPAAESEARARNTALGFHPSRGSAGRDPDKETFGHLAQAYLNGQMSHMEESTFDRLFIKLQRVILPELGNLDVRRLTPYRMDLYVNKRLKKGTIRNGKKIPITRTTVNNEVTYVQAILNWAIRRKMIRTNPLAGYKKPPRDDKTIHPVTAEESQELLAKAPAHLLRALALSYYTGLRPGQTELLRLRWYAVDWKEKTILIESARKKGPRSRIVPIHEEFYPLLRQWFEEDEKGSNAHIITWRGKPIKRISKSFQSAKAAAGILRKLPPYAFRHAFVTGLLGAGGDLKSVSEIVGHSRPDTTVKTYHHTNQALHRRVINTLPPLEIPPAKGTDKQSHLPKRLDETDNKSDS